MADWDPGLYGRFERERTRPARDLLNAVAVADPVRVADLGCGPGNSTQVLRTRYPAAALTGIDNSPAMLAQARARLPDAAFVQADIAHWRPDAPVDLIFANASLQWVPDHETLFPGLVAALAPGGALAVQMPDNSAEPTHVLMRETAAAGPWAARIAQGAAPRIKVLPLDAYYDLSVRCGCTVEVWRTIYHHVMESPAAIVDWLRATGLRPFLAALSPVEQEPFLADFRARLDKAYPPRADGRRLMAFPRIFMIARAAS